MPRHLATGTKLASAAACTLLIAVWAWSFRPTGSLHVAHRLTLKLAYGCIQVTYVSDTAIIGYPMDWPPGVYLRAEPPSTIWTPRLTSNSLGWALELPAWLPAILGLATACGVWRCASAIQRRERSRAGLCILCRYDRRGLPANANCPECSTTPTPAPK